MYIKAMGSEGARYSRDVVSLAFAKSDSIEPVF